MTRGEFSIRIKKHLLRTIKLVNALPEKLSYELLGKTLMQSATQAYLIAQSANSSKTKQDFAVKLEEINELMQETISLIGLISESGAVSMNAVAQLIKEGEDILATIDRTKNVNKRNNEELIHRVIME